MKLDAIIDDIQTCVLSLQKRVDELRTMDDKSAEVILFTRQQAADFIGKSLRQLDRDCREFGIRKVRANGGIRIPKIDLMEHMGLLKPPIPRSPQSDLDRIIGKYRQR